MRLAGFPGCCGVTILSDLDSLEYFESGYGWDDPYRNRPSTLYDDETKAAAKPKPLDVWQQVWKNVISSRKGLVFATTVRSQKAGIKQLKEQGFLALLTFRNPNTSGTEVTLWLKVVTKKGRLMFKFKNFLNSLAGVLNEAQESVETTSPVVAKQKDDGKAKKASVKGL